MSDIRTTLSQWLSGKDLDEAVAALGAIPISGMATPTNEHTGEPTAFCSDWEFAPFPNGVNLKLSRRDKCGSALSIAIEPRIRAFRNPHLADQDIAVTFAIDDRMAFEVVVRPEAAELINDAGDIVKEIEFRHGQDIRLFGCCGNPSAWMTPYRELYDISREIAEGTVSGPDWRLDGGGLTDQALVRIADLIERGYTAGHFPDWFLHIAQPDDGAQDDPS